MGAVKAAGVQPHLAPILSPFFLSHFAVDDAEVRCRVPSCRSKAVHVGRLGAERICNIIMHLNMIRWRLSERSGLVGGIRSRASRSWGLCSTVLCLISSCGSLLLLTFVPFFLVALCGLVLLRCRNSRRCLQWGVEVFRIWGGGSELYADVGMESGRAANRDVVRLRVRVELLVWDGGGSLVVGRDI